MSVTFAGVNSPQPPAGMEGNAEGTQSSRLTPPSVSQLSPDGVNSPQRSCNRPEHQEKVQPPPQGTPASPTHSRHRASPSIRFPPFWGGEVEHPGIQLAELEDLNLGEQRFVVIFMHRPQANAQDMIPCLQGTRGTPTVGQFPRMEVKAILPNRSMANSGSACPGSHGVAAGH